MLEFPLYRNVELWSPVYVVVQRKVRTISKLLDAMLCFDGGAEIGLFVPIFTTKELAGRFAEERENLGTGTLDVVPILLASELYNLLADSGLQHVAIDYARDGGIFIRVDAFLDELERKPRS
jgi:hypothetical protein